MAGSWSRAAYQGGYAAGVTIVVHVVGCIVPLNKAAGVGALTGSSSAPGCVLLPTARGQIARCVP